MTGLQDIINPAQQLQLQPQMTTLPGTSYRGGGLSGYDPSLQQVPMQQGLIPIPPLLTESQSPVLSGGQAMNKWLSDSMGARTISSKFPLNLAAGILPEETQKKIFMYMQQNYIWPQVCERRVFEATWDKLLKLARISMDSMDLNFEMDTNAGKDNLQNRNSPTVSDSVIFDAIDRLANMNHFISFKNRLPVQYQKPEYVETPFTNDVYHPLDDKIKAGNALLQWNADQVEFYRKHLIACRHHYTYGISYVHSGFEFKTTLNARQLNNGQQIQREEIEKIGTTFDPISVRRMWLDYRIPAWDMEGQPCPFFFTESTKFATLQNKYNPDTNPFGFVNQDKLIQGQYMFAQPEYASQLDAMTKTITQVGNAAGLDQAVPQVLKPDFSQNMLWTFFPMLPLDPQTGDWEKYADGTDVPAQRYIVQTYGSNLTSNQTLLRIQQNYYPKNKLPIYASCHMPDMDSGQYCPSIGQLLFNHYKEIVTCTNQFIANKDWINDPPAWIQQSSPSVDQDLTRKGAKLIVNGPQDFGWRQPYDATASTVAMRGQLREEARTTSKAVDAILGKAMGSRTSATEAANVFQAAMSGVTTDINLFNFDISGNFARRVWDYAGLWFDPDLLAAISGQFGFALKPEDLWLNIGIQTNVGSIFIESVVRQQNIRYVLESGGNDPTLNRSAFWKMLLKEMHFDNVDTLVNDQGFSEEVQRSTMQAILAYQGTPIPINPQQNHQIAIKVKSSFLEDLNSIWNQQHGENAQLLVRDVQLHQQFLLAEMQQQMMQQEQMAKIEAAENESKERGDTKAAPEVPERTGEVGQAAGGTLA